MAYASPRRIRRQNEIKGAKKRWARCRSNVEDPRNFDLMSADKPILKHDRIATGGIFSNKQTVG